MSIFSYFKLHYWPGFTFGIYVFTFLLSYLMSVLGGHAYGFFPYISDTGTTIPESCIFGQLLNFGALSLGITLYIRYRQVDIAITNGDFSDVRKWNNFSWWLALMFATGVSVVANFQETALLPVHMIGALVAFGMGSFYFVVQTRISYGSRYITPIQNKDFTISKKLYNLRFFVSIWLFPMFFICGISGTIALANFTGKSMPWWTEKEGGYTAHLVSTFSEWTLVILMLIYILTFTREFQTISFSDIGFVSKKVNPKFEPINVV